jgi:hypothetical protein
MYSSLARSFSKFQRKMIDCQAGGIIEPGQPSGIRLTYLLLFCSRIIDERNLDICGGCVYCVNVSIERIFLYGKSLFRWHGNVDIID